MRLIGASVLVTGGASGLGAATARQFVEAGAHVVVADLPSDRAAAFVDALGDHAHFVPVDVTDEAAVIAAFDRASELGPLRAAVNCAGVGLIGRMLNRGRPLPVEAFTPVIEVNLVGSFTVAKHAAAHMAATEPIDGERGVIVLTASIAAFDGQVGQIAYAASKAAVAGMTLPMARDLADHLIRAVTIAPGAFDTAMLAALPEPARVSLGAQVPHPSRLGDPAEFAGLVLHIVDNPMLNGETIRLDGAIRMAPR